MITVYEILHGTNQTILEDGVYSIAFSNNDINLILKYETINDYTKDMFSCDVETYLTKHLGCTDIETFKA
jgi:hypothetical protein